MLTISSGHSADYLLNAVATGRENYYTGAVAEGEPPGRWYGAGAEELGLTGLVDAQDMKAVFEHYLDPRDPNFRNPDKWKEVATLGHTGRKYQTAQEIYQRSLNAEPYADAERRVQLRLDASKNERKNVAFLDVTFSVQKSVTILHAAFEAQEVKARAAGDEEAARSWGEYRQAVEDAIWAGNNAGLDYLQQHAGYSRVGHHGGAAGRYVDAHKWTITSFFQHDSRDHDPQLHIHNPVSNRVLCADGVWRTLDSRGIHRIRPAAGAVAERTTAERLTSTLWVLAAMRPDGKAREIVGIPEAVNALYSSRSRAITPKTAQLVAAFETKFGREPNRLERDRLQRQATFATRKAKSHHGETTEQRLERVDRELRAEIDGGLGQLASNVLGLAAGNQPQPAQWSPSEVLETALADVQDRKSAWTAADLTRAINDALPDFLGLADGTQVATLLDQLTAEGLALAVALDADRPAERVLPDELRLHDGRSAYDAPAARLYATPEHIHTERLLTHAAGHRDAPALDQTGIGRFLDQLCTEGIELGDDQAAAIRGILTSGADVEALVGPAGTGKSFVVGVLAHAWQNPDLWDGQQRRVVGLASSQIATDVLTNEGLQARNIARWLGTQHRLADGKPSGDDARWRLCAGDLVVVDESAMANTTDLAAIHHHVTTGGAKLLLTGDHRQLAAVGRAGGMELAAANAPSYELSEARRFTHEWERTASLRLRDGDQKVLGDYHKHGRLIDAGAIEQAEASAARAWLADTLAGKRSLLIVDTNERAAILSAQIRVDLVRLGRVAEDGVPLGLQDTTAGVGDMVQARKNEWRLAGQYGNHRGPINREQYRVVQTLDDGGLIVTPINGADRETITLPRSYVAEHVALGYASTVHSAQGLTVDTSHTVVTQRTGPAALYVGLSRGRDANTAHVCTRAIPDGAPPGTVNQVAHRDPVTVIGAAFEIAQPEQSALATAEQSRAEAESIRTPSELFADACELATAGRTAGWLDELVDTGHLTGQQRAQLAAEDGASNLTSVLRRAELAGYDPHQILTEAVTVRRLDGARQLTNVIHHRITNAVTIDPRGDRHADRIPAVTDPAWHQYLSELAVTADKRTEQLGQEAATETPAWAVEALGAPPADEQQRTVWQQRAGIVAAHRELTGHDDPTTAIGPPPKTGQVEAYASWRTAWHALGRPEADRDEAELSDGQLRIRIRAYQREQTWAPAYVANELAGTRQAADQHRATATLRAAAAEATDDPDERDRLRQQAADAQGHAQELDQRAEQLAEVDDARARWYAHTAGTRAAADRAQQELADRHAEDSEHRADGRVTAVDHLDAGHDQQRDPAADQRDTADEREDGRHREITDEADLTDVAAQREADRRTVDDRQHPDAAETIVPEPPDLEDAKPRHERDHQVRVPTTDETQDNLSRARRALTQMDARDLADKRRTVEQARADQLARWHHQDRSYTDTHHRSDGMGF